LFHRSHLSASEATYYGRSGAARQIPPAPRSALSRLDLPAKAVAIAVLLIMRPTLTEPASPEWPDIRSWRVHTRRLLTKERLSRDAALHEQMARQATARLRQSVDLARYETLGVYSPMRGEIDILNLAAEHIARGGQVALPVVVEKAAPVEFWRWWPGMAMTRGVWNIPIPAQRECMLPDALIVPLLGFDAALYRLGYGGGYYDRTLTQAVPRPYCIGLGFQSGKVASIYPQTHDIPMNLIITEDRLYPEGRQP
jgi:5-formyltetrahydrofolate cyclo-ligase